MSVENLEVPMKIEIETMIDVHDCDTCGSSWSNGGVVYINGVKVLTREPSAYCFDSPSFSESDLLVMALKKIGVDVFVDQCTYPIYSHDDEYHGHTLGEEQYD